MGLGLSIAALRALTPGQLIDMVTAYKRALAGPQHLPWLLAQLLNAFGSSPLPFTPELLLGQKV